MFNMERTVLDKFNASIFSDCCNATFGLLEKETLGKQICI